MRWYIAAVSCVALLSCDSVSSNTGNGPVSGLDPVLRTPAFTSMTAISGGVRIEFRNLSAPTTELQLTREQFGSVQMVASLPPSATSYDDHLDGPGLYTYKLVAFFGLQTRSQPAERSWVAQADPSSGFRVAPQRIVPAWLAIRTADGSFAMAGNIDGWDCGAPYNRSPPYYVSP